MEKNYLEKSIDCLYKNKTYDSIINNSTKNKTETSNLSLLEKINELKNENQVLRENNINLINERDRYKLLSEKYYKNTVEMAEEIIVMRNQIDKFLNFKK
jgi:hypothetical protein